MEQFFFQFKVHVTEIVIKFVMHKSWLSLHSRGLSLSFNALCQPIAELYYLQYLLFVLFVAAILFEYII